MIGFAQIAGGAPSSTGALTDHLLNSTVGQEQARLAAYYSRGAVKDLDLVGLAQQMADGELAFSEALDRAATRTCWTRRRSASPTACPIWRSASPRD